MLVELSRVPASDQELYVWRHPRLLEPSVVEGLAVEVARWPRSQRRVMVKALDGVRVIRERYEAQPEGYPIGVGPLETVWQQVDSEQISAQEGERLVSVPPFTAALSARYLKSLSDWAVDEAQRGRGSRR